MTPTEYHKQQEMLLKDLISKQQRVSLAEANAHYRMLKEQSSRNKITSGNRTTSSSERPPKKPL